MVVGHWNRSPATKPASLTVARILSRPAPNRQPDGNHSQGHWDIDDGSPVMSSFDREKTDIRPSRPLPHNRGSNWLLRDLKLAPLRLTRRGVVITRSQRRHPHESLAVPHTWPPSPNVTHFERLSNSRCCLTSLNSQEFSRFWRSSELLRVQRQTVRPNADGRKPIAVIPL